MAHLSLSEFYKKYIKNLNSIQHYPEVLDNLLAITTNHVEELNTLELQAIKNNQPTLLCFLLVDKKEPANTEEFDKFIQVVKHIFNLFFFEVLNQNASTPLLRFFGNSYSSLSLAVEYFCKLYLFANKQTGDKKQMYEEMLDRWKQEVIDPLLAKEVSADKGNVAGRSILGGCLNYVASGKPDDKLYPLCWQLLISVNDINQKGNGLSGGATPLSIAVRRKFPLEFIEELLKKGADVNVLIYAEVGHIVKQPLLNFIIKNKNYPMLRFLLEHGADVNKMPEYEGYLSESSMKNESILTPYQLAVALGDEEAVDIIVQHAKQNNINLLTELHEKESERNYSLNLKVTCGELALECKSRFLHSSEKILENIQAKYGLRVYVKYDSDRQAITEAMNWLFEGVLQSAAKQFWLPALACLKEEIIRNKKFAIYVSEAPAQVKKRTDCAGLFHKNIYMQSGLAALDKHLYVTQIAHEIGHLLDHTKLHIKRLKGLMNPETNQFMTAIEKDLASINLATCPSYIQMRIRDIQLFYNEHNKMQDYFTVILIETPIALAIQDPSMTETQLMDIMCAHFPATVDWYQNVFMHENKSVEQMQNMCLKN